MKDEIKNEIKNWTLKIANETWILDTMGLKKFEFLQLIICCKLIFSCQKWNWNFQNLCISSDFWRQIFGNIRAKYSNIRIIFGFWKLHRIEYEYQYSEENIRIFVYTLFHTPRKLWKMKFLCNYPFSFSYLGMSLFFWRL